MDSGLSALLMMAELHGIAADEAKLKHEFGNEAFSVQKILLAAQSLGLKAQLVVQSPGRLDRAPLPAIALDRDGKEFWRMPQKGEMTLDTRLFHPANFIALIESLKQKDK